MDTAFLVLTKAAESLVVTPGISDRCSEAEEIVGVELVIVGDEVVVNLRTDKDVAPCVVANPEPPVQEEMGAVQVGAATAGGERASSDAIEEQGHETGASHEVTVGFGCKPVRVDAIGIDDDWAIELEVVVNALVIAEGGFNVNAAVFFIQVLEEEAGIGTTS